MITGADQTGIAGAHLPQTIPIQLRRPGGHFAPSWSLTVHSISGNPTIPAGNSVLQGEDGSITVNSVGGVIELDVTLGSQPGVQLLELTVPGIVMEPVVTTISLTATAT